MNIFTTGCRWRSSHIRRAIGNGANSTIACAVACLLWFASSVGAQTAAGVSFTASTNQGDGTSTFSGYKIDIHSGGSASSLRLKDIGAPAMDANRTVTYLDSAFFSLPDGAYDLYVIAYGPAGSSSTPAVPFSISSGSLSAPNAPGGVTFIVCESSAAPASEIVLYASDATIVGNRWSRIADVTAAGGQTLYLSDTGSTKLSSASATPASYVEYVFAVKAGTPYHIWVRLKADKNSYTNDSLFAQFTSAVNASGQPIARIGTTTSMTLFLEEGTGANVHGWGWNDNGYGTLGANVYFAADGFQTLRVQQREDGVRLDQVVISPALYLSTRPGALKDDTTIIAKPQ